MGPGWSGGHGGQPDDGIIAHGGDGFQRHVSGALDNPFIVLLQEDCADEPADRRLIGKDADDFGSPLDLAVETLDRIGGVQLRPMRGGEAHIGEHVGFGFVHQRRELPQLGAQLVGDPAPLRSRGRRSVLSEGGGDESRNNAPAALAGMGERVAEKVNSAALPTRVHDFGDPALMPSWASETTSLTPRRPRRLSLRRNSVQKVSASEGPMSMPKTSRRPSLFTPTATMTATETMRPLWRTFT